MEMEQLLRIMQDMQEMVSPEDALTACISAYAAEHDDLDSDELELIAAAGECPKPEDLLKKYGML